MHVGGLFCRYFFLKNKLPLTKDCFKNKNEMSLLICYFVNFCFGEKKSAQRWAKKRKLSSRGLEEDGQNEKDRSSHELRSLEAVHGDVREEWSAGHLSLQSQRPSNSVRERKNFVLMKLKGKEQTFHISFRFPLAGCACLVVTICRTVRVAGTKGTAQVQKYQNTRIYSVNIFCIDFGIFLHSFAVPVDATVASCSHH